MRIPILFLGGAKRVSLARHIKRTALEMGHQAVLYSYELDFRVPVSSEAEVIVGKRWSDPNVIPDLVARIRELDIRAVLAFVDPSVLLLPALARLCPGVFIPVSDAALVETMYDKVLTALWFRDHGIPQPAFFDPAGPFRFPLILKPRTGSASRGLLVARSERDLPSCGLGDYLVSEYVSDRTEYSVDCYVSQRGQVTSLVPRVRLETAGGEAVRSMTLREADVEDLSMRILQSGPFRGPVTLQFLRDGSDLRLMAMEVNPRLGGGVVTSIGAGSGLVRMMLEECLGHEIGPVTDWRDHTLMVRYPDEVIFYQNDIQNADHH